MYEHYAIIDENDKILEYPTNPRVFLTEQNCYNVPEYWTGGILNGKKYVYCHNFEPTCPYDKNHVEGLPLKDPDNGLWYRQYYAVDATPEEIEQRTLQRKQAVINSVVVSLKTIDELQAQITEYPPEEQEKWAQFRQAVSELPLIENPWEVKMPKSPNDGNNLTVTVERL